MTTQRLFKAICFCTLLMLGLSACSTSGTPSEEVDPLINTGWFQLRNDATGKCLDGGGTYGAYAYLRGCDNGDNDNLLWRFQERQNGTILENKVDNLCLRGTVVLLLRCPEVYVALLGRWHSIEVGSGQNPSVIGLASENTYLSVAGNDAILVPRDVNDPYQNWSFIAR